MARKKIKQTWLSTLFISAFFWGVKSVVAPVPLAGTLVDVLESYV